MAVALLAGLAVASFAISSRVGTRDTIAVAKVGKPVMTTSVVMLTR